MDGSTREGAAMALIDDIRAFVPGCPQEEADRLLIREEQSSLLRLAIGSLPDKYRTVLMLSVVEEMDTDEISALLHITPSSVRCQLSRAKQQLIKWYRK
jgi:RNA polymerase sigma factor (sigma-70 family)